MNQHDFVVSAQRQMDELGMRPTLEPKRAGNEFDEAHFPLPNGMGNDFIPLHPLDHAIQGIFQSEDVGRKCFHSAPTLKALYKTPNYWPAGWFEACDLYDEWMSKHGKKVGFDSRDKRLGIHGATPEQRAEWLKKAIKANALPTRVINERLGIDREFAQLKEAAEFVGASATSLIRWREGKRKSQTGWTVEFA